MFIPPNCLTLDKIKEPQIRLGLQGFPGVGKTWAALTFPNPIVFNLDKGLGAHFGRKDVIEIPIYNEDYCKSIWPNYKTFSDKRYVIEKWFTELAPKLDDDQTLVFDGGTGLQRIYHKWWENNPALTKQGKVDDFAEWKLKINFLGTLFEQAKLLKCNFVYICHESEKKDKDGMYTGKIRPLMTGQFCDELVSHFTDWFRCHAKNKPIDFASVKSETLKEFGCKNIEAFKEVCNYSSNDTVYYWQTQSDELADCKASSLINFPRYIAANFETFRKYSKFITSLLPPTVTMSDLQIEHK